ncbi:MAG: GntR family transcriptional regulator [Fibrobacteres bacterium CG2_30_45_31]|nr:MAG: GntR family transcriptional regulator [Fibrobacteres bacterium CG2_30_45_31]
MLHSFLYREIAKNIERKIETGVFKAGEKLPSIRTICREQGVSMSTALEAYYSLEGKGLVASYPKSGYYVCQKRRDIAKPNVSTPGHLQNADATHNLVSKVFSEFDFEKTILFSVGVPSQEYLPLARLNKELHKAILTLPGNGTQYESVQGNPKLRRQLALQSMHWNGNLTEEDLVITSGCMDAIGLCLMAVLKPGDSIAIESPVYFGLLQLAKGLGLNVIELSTDAQTGIDVDALKRLAKSGKIKACCLISNFNNPLGSSIPSESKKEIVEWMAKYNVVIIEDDLYGDLYFESRRPLCCKTFDVSGNVLWCGSVSKTLAPGYRVGWVAPGKYKEQILQQKLINSVSAVTLQQEAVATFFESGRYENHLRKLRNTLCTNSLKMIDSIVRHFPEDTRLSTPKGGFMIWVELNKNCNTSKLFDILMEQHISIAPGRMFTLQNQYQNCMRLSFGLVWNKKIEDAIAVIGKELKRGQ